ncbi:MAG: MFS transporter [Microbacteriaceae bacterium]
MKRYGDLFRIPGLTAVVTSQLLARFPGGMLPLGLLIHVQQQTGLYAIAGLVLAAEATGQAVASPVATRLMSRFGIRPVLGTMAVISVMGMIALALIPVSPVIHIPLGLLVGLTLPPIQPAARAVYPTIVAKHQIQSLQSLDASVQELIWILGPVITVFISTQFGGAIGVLAPAVFGAVGGLWFLTRPAVAKTTLSPSTGKIGAVLKKPAVLVVVFSGLLVVGSFAAIEAATVATFGSEKSSPAGLILGLWAAASLVGGLAMGHTPIGSWSLTRRLAFVVAGSALAMFTVDPILLTLALLVAGIGVAPAMTVQYAVATESVDAGDLPESLGWLGTGWVIGAAFASAIAGFVIDEWGSVGGFALATVFAMLAALVPAIWIRQMPNLKHLVLEHKP